MNSKKKNGLVVIYDPNSLRQFIWYYSTVSKDTEWDVLCFPYGDNLIHMEEYCKRSQIFRKIFVGETNYSKMPLFSKFILFSKFFVFFLLGKQRIMAQKILNEYVEDVGIYDLFVTNGDIGLIGGLVAQFAKEKNVVYLEDGAWDYKARSRWLCTFKTFSFVYWQGLLMSRMGYCSKGRFYFEPTKYCTKYCTFEKKMKYRNYKILKEFSYEYTDFELYNGILARLYPELSDGNLDQVDMVIFTDPVKDFTNDPGYYIEKVENYVSQHARKIALKKHPRDIYTYSFEQCECIEIDQKIPAELLLPFIKQKKIMFFLANCIMLSLSDLKYDLNIFFFDELSKSDDRGFLRKYYQSEDDLKTELSDVNCHIINIIHI